ncbi:MAG TPA: nucleoside triphosphate pyrophosphohydrolase [Steroidobacteraceae bacterium]|nr:nucleoside triphosphate pyrophosphohydrolase [Steroidobacteraceae bacterium]
MKDDTAIARLIEIMRRLRDPQAGCPWDREQTFETIVPYTIEEAYEVADTVDRRDYQALRGELGDLLFQVVFHSRLAEERGYFQFADVANAISDKLVERHPHVFAGARFATSQDQNAAWERQKADEKAARGQGALDDVPLTLPALKRAEKLGKRAAAVGFDWPDASGARTAIAGELCELDVAIGAHGSSAAMFDELGDVLFSVVNLARHLGVDPEEALRAGNRKFAARFQAVERAMKERGKSVAQGTAEELDELWRRAKETVP